RRVRSTGGRPAIRAGIVSPAGVQGPEVTPSTPDDHFAAGPHCRVSLSATRCVAGVGGAPTIRTRVVSAASVQIVKVRIDASPDDPFAAGPDWRVQAPAIGCVGRAGGGPVIDASARLIRYCR